MLATLWTHTTLRSLTKQLNSLGFRCSAQHAADEQLEYSHPKFVRGKRELIAQIVAVSQPARQKRPREDSGLTQSQLDSLYSQLRVVTEHLQRVELSIQQHLQALHAKLESVIAAYASGHGSTIALPLSLPLVVLPMAVQQQAVPRPQPPGSFGEMQPCVQPLAQVPSQVLLTDRAEPPLTHRADGMQPMQVNQYGTSS